MTEANSLNPVHLRFTNRGLDWVSQFEPADRILAEELLASLTLVSRSEFERSIEELIRAAALEVKGAVALYAAREINEIGHQSLLDRSVDAIARGADVGSEGHVAALLRGIARSEPAKFLNHPNLADLRESKCEKIVVVDDLIGSGGRVVKYLDSIWKSRSIKSWWSRKLLRFEVLAYTGTSIGQKVVRKHRARPSMQIVRDCPTLESMPIGFEARDSLRKLCTKYGGMTSKKSMALGYLGTEVLLVFEHGCPNNVPAILWAPKTDSKPWLPLFPARSVLLEEKSAFPPEIVRRDSVSILLAAGQKHLARSGGLAKPEPLGSNVLIALALMAKGVRRPDSLGYATGLSSANLIDLLENCVKWGLITLTHRLTREGLAELGAARNLKNAEIVIPPRGEEDYYPKSLRAHIGG